MQSRFLKNFNRFMTNIDFNSWVGIRVFGEAITKNQVIRPQNDFG